jgi:hypothetical protein
VAVQGAVHRDGGGLAYNVNLENIINVSTLAYTRLRVKHDSQGQPIKAMVRASTTVRRGNAYAVRVIVMCTGTALHTETKVIQLTATRDGGDL